MTHPCTAAGIDRRNFLRLGGLAAAAVAMPTVLPGCSSSGDEGHKLIAAHNVAEDDPYDLGMQKFAELVESKTDGEVSVEIHPNGALGDVPAVFQSIEQGTVDVTVASPADIAEWAPAAQLLVLPFLVGTQEHRTAVIESPVAQQLSDMVQDAAGVNIMGFFGGGARNMFFNKPAESIADVAGRAFRVDTSALLADMFAAMGLAPEPLAWGELYGAIQQGLVEGAENELVYINSFSMFEVAPHMLLTNHELTFRPFVIGQKTLDGLPEDLRSAVLSAGEEAARYESELEVVSNDEALAGLQDKMDSIVEPPDLDAAVAAVEPLWYESAKSWGMEDALEQILAMREA